MIIFRYSLKRNLKQPIVLISNFALPIALMFISGFWQEGNWSTLPFGVGVLSMILMFTAFILSKNIEQDRLEGTITRFQLAPITSLQYLWQNLLASIVPLFTLNLIVTGLGMVMYNWSLGFSVLLFVSLSIFTSSCVALSYAWSNLIPSQEASLAVFSVVMTFASMLSGALMPLEYMPFPLNRLGAIFPSFWFMQGLGSLIEEGVGVQFFVANGIVLVLTFIFLLLGAKRKK
ncbi:MAG: ABC transporter permease [Streptococcaceae bacterium]|jgi:ABC-2 type transport system permease protein|nr:ABC transporter permease [Streptococcaceae bacterium]